MATPDYSRLIAQLAQSRKLDPKDSAYNAIVQLIKAVQTTNADLQAQINALGTGTGDVNTVAGAPYVEYRGSDALPNAFNLGGLSTGLLSHTVSGGVSTPSVATIGSGLSFAANTLSATSGGGALVLLEQHSASASADLRFTSWYSSTYDEYEIHIVNLIPATDDVTVQLECSTDAGSTYDTGANYGYGELLGRIASTVSVGATTGRNNIRFADHVSTTASYPGLSGRLILYNPGSAIYKSVLGHIAISRYNNATADTYTEHISGLYLSTTAVNAFRVITTSGNIASGNIRVYGIAKS